MALGPPKGILGFSPLPRKRRNLLSFRKLSNESRFLCTSAAAEVVYLTALEALTNGSFEITPLSNIFYRRFLPNIAVGNFPLNSSEFLTLWTKMVQFGDSFLSTVQQHAFQNGSISEEFDRYFSSFSCLGTQC